MNKLYKYISQYFVFGNIYIGIIAGSLAWANSAIFYTKIDDAQIKLYWFIFFSSIFIYNLDRVISRSADYTNNPQRTIFFQKHKNCITITVLTCFTGMALLVGSLNNTLRVLSLILFIITACYLLYFNGRKNDQIRGGIPQSSAAGKFAFLKPVALGLVWTAVTVLLPVLVRKPDRPDFAIGCLFAIRFLQYTANGILFDYRDAKGDLLNNKGNLFLVWNETKILQGVLGILLVTFLFIVYSRISRILPWIILADIMVVFAYSLLAFYFLNRSKYPASSIEKTIQHPMFYPLLVDGITIVPAIFTLIFIRTVDNLIRYF